MRKKAFLYIIITGILWGTSGIFVHFLAPYGFTSFQMTATRALVSFLCMAVFALVRDRGLFRIQPHDLLLCVGIGFALFGTGGFYFTSMQMTSVSTAVVLMYTAPIYVMIFSVLFLGEKFSKLKLMAIICVFVGCCLVSGLVGGLKFDLMGILIGALSGVSYAAYNIFTKIAMQRNCRSISVNIYGFLTMLLISLCLSEPHRAVASIREAPLETIPLLLALGVFTFVIPYILYTLALKVLPAGTASSLSVVEPMAATVFSVLLFHENLDLFSGIGIVLILVAVFLLGRAEKNNEDLKGEKR